MTSRQQQIVGLLLILLALFVGNTFKTTPIVLLAVCLAGFVVYVQRNRSREHRERRWLARLGIWFVNTILVVAIFGLTIAWQVGDQLGENFNIVYVGTEILSHSFLFVMLLAWMERPHRGHVSMLPCGLLVVLFCAAAGGTSLSLSAQTSVAMAATIGFTVASHILLSVRRGSTAELFARSDDPSVSSPSQSRSWMVPVISLLTLSVLTMATTTIARGTNRVLPRIQEVLQKQLEATFDPSSEEAMIGGTRYVDGSKLGAIRRHMIGSPQDLALRVRCDVRPGYLRGSAFDMYAGGRWYSVAHSARVRGNRHPSFDDRSIFPSGPAKVDLVERSGGLRARFPLSGNQSDKTINLEIQNDPLKGAIVFLPMQSRWIESVSREVVLSSHRVVQAGSVNVEFPYVAGVGLTPVVESLDSVRRRVLLDVPTRTREVAERIVNEVCAGQPSARGKADAISKFFQENYSYTLNLTSVDRDAEPLTHFLTTRHAAHCEYFASATVVLLRQAGIPARYVTGYVADEYNDELLVWVARNRDAHAWAEAYDEQSGQWFPVESTPNRTYHTVDAKDDSEDDAGFFDVFGDDEDSDDDGLFSRIFGWFFSIRFTDPLFLVFRIAQLPLFFVLVFFLWSRRYVNVRKGEAAIDFQSRKMLKKVDRQLRRYSMVRRPSETLYQFADRIEARIGDVATPLRDKAKSQLQNSANWYRGYATARYQGEMPQAFATTR